VDQQGEDQVHQLVDGQSAVEQLADAIEQGDVLQIAGIGGRNQAQALIGQLLLNRLCDLEAAGQKELLLLKAEGRPAILIAAEKAEGAQLSTMDA
jgi:hypothetical protein